MSRPHSPEHTPVWSRELFRTLFLWLMNYHVQVEGQMSLGPAIMALYPHSEHPDSFLIPAAKNGIYLSARDAWADKPVNNLVSQLVVANIPVTRRKPANITRAQFEVLRAQEAQAREAVIAERKKLALYPQGTRYGKATSLEQLMEQCKPGMVKFSHEFGVPIYPIGIVHEPGYEPSKYPNSPSGIKALNNYRHLHRPPKREVLVKIGDPIEPPISEEEIPSVFGLTITALWNLVHGSAVK